MKHSFLNLILGNFEEKRTYRRFQKRVGTLPTDYRFAFRKIQHYVFCVGIPGGDFSVLTDLLELFESGAAAGQQVLGITGPDVGRFCQEWLQAASSNTETPGETLNREILQQLRKEDA